MTPAAPRSNEEHFVDPEVVAEYAAFDFLLPAESGLLADLPDDALRGRVLDLGVGGGRTTPFLAPDAARYTAIDLSPAMVEACTRRFPELPPGTFRTGDARALPDVPDGSVDLVVFAFQGIDSVLDHDDRLAVLREVSRAIRPGGWFAFSSDNLDAHRRAASYALALRRITSGPGQARRALRRVRRFRAANGGALPAGPHSVVTIVRDVRERPVAGARARTITIAGYAVEHGEQVARLHEAGFDLVRTYLPDGSLAGPDDRRLRRAQVLHYAARRAGGPA